ncbi:conserved hypothetical protein [Theileria orientalis strain Shintoku]|uniref:Uncharacterized protein n=1 Tax=Theileria orientalis strain Shintoku TaxID=869250 RepID=J4CD45_THEOR|nr:conserved hypothetical protein [Theileria orientalis strain Shintoku]BAM40502.1 conserved hypothetical protein [Theileria orientalis strain Shintoku]|eukprot:XP_009690803.1 conserved hypothetical protein [Theileria orientalis strain Shintoku]
MLVSYLLILSCVSIRQPWVTCKLQKRHCTQLNRNKIIGFINRNYKNTYGYKIDVKSRYLSRVNDTHKLKDQPSALHSQEDDRTNRDGRAYFQKNYHKFKKIISPLDSNVTVLDSAVSIWAYVIPLMKCSENFEHLLFTLNLPSLVNKLILRLLNIKTVISSIPNLMDVIMLTINKVFLVENRLNLSHFIRFNFTQGNILYMYVNLLSLFYSDFITPLGDSLVPTFVGYTLMFSSIAPLFYCMICSLLGKYAQLPIVSQAAEMTVNSRRLARKLTK